MYQAVFKVPGLTQQVSPLPLGVGFHRRGNGGVSNLPEITLPVGARASAED